LPNPHFLRNQPCTQADVTFAKANHVFPQPAAGVAGGAAPAGPIIGGAGGHARGAAGAALPGGGGVTGPEPIPPPVPPVAAQLPTPYYPFDFWPAPPWQQNPDTSIWPTLHQLQNKVGEHSFLRTWGHLNVQHDPNEVGWYGVKFLGVGGFGSAGLWVHVNAHNSITEVKMIPLYSLSIIH
jgi:hypothetical protein